MTNLKNKQILLVGTGHMGLNVLTALLKDKNIDPNDITAIIGESAHSDLAAVCDAAEKVCRNSSDKMSLFSRRDVDNVFVQEMAQPDILFLAVKPDKLNKALQLYTPLLKPNTTIISMVAGIEEKKYKLPDINKKNLVRVMPHMPRIICAIHGRNKKAVEVAEEACHNLGEPLILPYEQQMHAATALMSSFPAYLAQFIASFYDENHPEDSERNMKAALNILGNFAAGKTVAASGTSHFAIVERCKHFYNNSLGTAHHYLGKEAGETGLTKTIAATVAELEKGDLSKEFLTDYINKIRSPKGVTNIGLIFLGNPPPDDSRFGDEEQLLAQKAWAKNYSHGKVEALIRHAIIASIHRSESIASYPKDPIAGISTDKVYDVAKTISKEISKEIGRGGHLP